MKIIQRNKSLSAAPPATTKLFIDGKAVESQTDKWVDLRNPATNEVITKVPQATQSEMQNAVNSAKEVIK